MMELDDNTGDFENLIFKFMGKSEITTKIQEMVNRNQKRLVINLDQLRQFSPELLNMLIKNPLKVVPIFEKHLLDLIFETQNTNGKMKTQKDEKTIQKKQVYSITFEGTFGRNMVSPRGLSAELTNQLVCIQGIVTRMSIVRPKLESSVHYCEETKKGEIKDYYDHYSISMTNQNSINGNFAGGEGKGSSYMSNTVPKKDNHGNPYSFEYGLSTFRDFQTLLVQEPPERTPVGQLPRSVEVILRDDLVDKVKPGDRIQVVGVFKSVNSLSTNNSGVVRTIVIATNVQSITSELEIPKLSGEDLRNIKEIGSRSDAFDILANSISPAIFGHTNIKKALILQLLGGVEKNLENGTHLRGDINVMLVGDPSTAKSQFLRHMLAISPNAINTTGRGSSGVGLTAAVVVDKDTGERHLEAGAMVLGDRGIVCIDEFDKMNDADRVAIHEVMEQQTVTIAKAGIHVSLNARCSVLAAANPIYGEYQDDLPVGKNIGLPESLLSRFDLCFVVVDNSKLDSQIADRVLCNHMYPAETPTIVNQYDEKIIEPEIHLDDHSDTQIFEKQNALLNGESQEILTRSFLRKYLHYTKKTTSPVLTEEASKYITSAWTQLRAKNEEENGKNPRSLPITVRTLETLIRLATAHAKVRLAKIVNLKDCQVAFDLLSLALFFDSTNADEDTLREVEEVHISEKPNKAKIADSGKKTANKGMMMDEEDESEIDSYSEKQTDKKTRRDPQERNIDNILSSSVPTGPVSDSKKLFVYKVIYENLKNKEYPAITIDKFWNILTDHKDFKTSNIFTKSDLLDVVFSLDNDGKVMFTEDSKEIVLI